MSLALRPFAQAVGAGLTKRIVVVLIGLGSTAVPRSTCPTGGSRSSCRPPPRSSNPLSIYGLTRDEPLANQHFPTLEALEETLAERGDRLQHQPEVIRSSAAFHWLPAA
jgi:hypothetical protein